MRAFVLLFLCLAAWQTRLANAFFAPASHVSHRQVSPSAGGDRRQVKLVHTRLDRAPVTAALVVLDVQRHVRQLEAKERKKAFKSRRIDQEDRHVCFNMAQDPA